MCLRFAFVLKHLSVCALFKCDIWIKLLALSLQFYEVFESFFWLNLFSASNIFQKIDIYHWRSSNEVVESWTLHCSLSGAHYKNFSISITLIKSVLPFVRVILSSFFLLLNSNLSPVLWMAFGVEVKETHVFATSYFLHLLGLYWIFSVCSFLVVGCIKNYYL